MYRASRGLSNPGPRPAPAAGSPRPPPRRTGPANPVRSYGCVAGPYGVGDPPPLDRARRGVHIAPGAARRRGSIDPEPRVQRGA